MEAKEILTDKIIYGAVEFQKNEEFWVHGRYENGLVAEVPSDKVRLIPEEVRLREAWKQWKNSPGNIIITSDSIDWEQRKFEVAKALYPICLQKDGVQEFEAWESESAESLAISYAKVFVEEYKNSLKHKND